MKNTMNRLWLFMAALVVITLPVVSVESAPGVLRLADYTQPNVLYCGPTAIYLVMDYWGMEHADFGRLVGLLFRKEFNGTPNSSMVFCAGLFGLKAYSFSGNLSILKKLLNHRIPVIVLQDLSKHIKLGHFRIVVGIDSRHERVLVRDPARRKIRRVKLRKFEQLWDRGNTINNRRWSMILIPEFIDFHDEAIEASPLTALNLGTFYYRNFDYHNACAAFEDAYKQDPGNPDVLQYYIQVLIRLKRFDQAFRLIEQLIALNPSDPVAYDLLGLTYFYSGDYESSLKNLELARKLNKNPKENTFIAEHLTLVRRFIEQRKR